MDPPTLTMAQCDDANALSAFLSKRDYATLADAAADAPFTAIVVCGSAVLATVEAAVAALGQGLAPRVLFSGGVGHSTQLLLDALAASPHPRSSAEGAAAPSEAEALRDYAMALGAPAGALLVETASTNCGANAALSRAALLGAGLALPHRLLLLQDPTMQLRTHASFERAYAGDAPGAVLRSWAPAVPRLEGLPGAGAAAAGAPLALALHPPRVWTMERFLALLLGEVPRLADAPGGYGPRGAGYIAHVHVPEAIVAAHARLAAALQALQAARAVAAGGSTGPA